MMHIQLKSSPIHACLAIICLAFAPGACSTNPALLNSERIERQFGSYGIEVLAYKDGVRRSNLYSNEDDGPVCRTYALVIFAEEIDERIAAAHQKVLAGSSLGATFKAEGWEVLKETTYIGSYFVDAGESQVAELMKLQDRSVLALHVYQLSLARGNTVIDYATIAESHHPDYLGEGQLLRIYPHVHWRWMDPQSVASLQRLITATPQD